MSYSSDDFFREWRFQIEKDFVKPDKSPFEYNKNGLKEWNDELLNIPYPSDAPQSVPKCVAISDDGRYIAISAGWAVNVFDLSNFENTYTLTGHVSDINAIAFRPGSSNQLVSVAMNLFYESKPADPQIILWDLKIRPPKTHAMSDTIERLARNTANLVIAELKSEPHTVPVGAADQIVFAKSLEIPFKRLLLSKDVVDNTKLFGRLMASFQSQIFSPSGEVMLYMPGEDPDKSGNDEWEMRLYAVDEQKDAFAMFGHESNIVWAGFNSDGSLIGSASWDRTFRIWDAKNGKTKFLFLTSFQNWTGGFSPDGSYFAGTSGDGKLHVYSLLDGSERMVFDSGNGWPRALSWHPNSQMIAIGGQVDGKLFLLDVKNKNIHQHRKLSIGAMRIPPDDNGWFDGFRHTCLSCDNVCFVDGGCKIAFFTAGDGSAEVYDIESYSKWRFARVGTMNSPDDNSEVTSRGGYEMLVHEDHKRRQIMLVTIDADAVRLWSVPMSS